MGKGNGSVPILRDDRAVGFLRVFHVQAKVGGEVRWKHDVVAQYETEAEDLAKEFILDDANGISELAREPLVFSSERAKNLDTQYGWVIGVR